MKLTKISTACAVAAATLFSASSHAQISGDTIKIGFITDLSGLYADIDGPAGAEAIRMAIADMGGAVAGKKIEVMVADHQNKPDIAAAKAREWFDQDGMDMLVGGTAFGTALQADATEAVKAAGGSVVGSVRHPLSASDFSSFLLQAQSSKAQILGLANAGGDTINAIKSANEFGITKTMKLAGLLMFINDVHSLGLKATQGMYLTDSWYWNQSPEATAWSKRFFEKFKRMPSSLQAADYSAVRFYLDAVKALNSDDGDKVMAKMRTSKVNDMYAKGGYIRPDGRMIHDMFLMQVKTPAQSTTPWDYFNIVATTKGEEAFTTKAESKCTLWK